MQESNFNQDNTNEFYGGMNKQSQPVEAPQAPTDTYDDDIPF